MIAVVTTVAVMVLALCIIMAAYRVIAGPSQPDRVIALDTIATNTVGLILVLAAFGFIYQTTAEPLLREALETRRRVLGEQHPDTSRSLNDLGLVLESQGRAADAPLAAQHDLVREALGDYVCDQFLLVKRAEWSDYRRYVSPWERERYGE